MASITIPLYYDLDLLLWTSAAGGIARQPNLVLGQSDSIAFAVQFVRSGVVIELTSPAWICGIKPINDVAGDYLCQTTTGVKTGSTTTTVYTFTLLLDSDELRAWLLTVTAVSNYAAFSIRDTVNLIATLPAITCTILPDYTLEGTTPTAASGILIVDSGQTFTVHKTFAMPTTDGTDTYILQTNGAGVGSWVAKPSGGVTSVEQSFTGGIVSVGGSPITTSGTLALTVLGTSGGLVYFSSTSAWASSAAMGAGALVVGGGAGATPTALAAVASGRVLTSAGTLTTPAYSSTITLGASGTLGTITLGNATSGTILITPPTGVLGTPTLTLPITSTTLAGLSVAQTFNAAQTFSSTVSLTLDTDATSSTAGGTLTVTGGASVSQKLFVGSLLDIVATTATAGQITQAGTQFIHSYGTNNLFLGGAGNPTVANMSGNGLNVAIGKLSLGSATTTTGNMAIGKSSLGAITTSASFSNVAVGNQCLDVTTFAIESIAIGNNCQRSISSQYSVTIGNLANAGNYSVAIGYDALNGTNANALACVAVGRDAMKLCTGERNTACGHSAGSTITSGTYNSLFGEMAQTGSASATYRTAIGAGAVGNLNNSIKLGRDILDVVVLPKMTTTERGTYGTPVAGSLIFNTTTGKLNVYSGTAWEAVTSI